MQELIIDSFAGGGGASTGIAAALGRGPDYAINHNAEALAMHAANHPDCEHLSKNIWQVDPMDVICGRPVGLAWFSPDCKHFSKAKGGRPVKRNVRDLAWTVILWARRARPRVIILENVEEFQQWGPLKLDEARGEWKPDPERLGETFRRWLADLRRLGYRVEYRELRACDYGAPTIRKRFFLIARRDGQKIVWPKPTHGPGLIPYRTAAEIIDWSLPCHSIFLSREEGRAVGVKRPLVAATMERIAKGIKRYVLDAAEPFIVTLNHGGAWQRGWGMGEPFRTVTASRDAHALIVPYIERQFGNSAGADIGEPMGTVMPGGGGKTALVAAHISKFQTGSVGADLVDPLPTITANSFHKRPGGAPPLALVAAFLAQHNLGVVARDARDPLSTVTSTGAQQAVVSAGMLHMKGTDRRASGVDEPVRTITAGGYHAAEVRAFLMKYYGTDQDPRLTDPACTVTTRDRLGLVLVHGEPYQIVDIGMRMLTPRELFAAQGFPADYVIDPEFNGKPLTREAQIRMCGNSVCPPLAEALVRANYEPATVRRGLDPDYGDLFERAA